MRTIELVIKLDEGVEMKFAKRAVSGRLSEEATEDEYEDDEECQIIKKSSSRGQYVNDSVKDCKLILFENLFM